MGDGRACSIALLDGNYIAMKINPSLLGNELFALVASRFSLHEKDYFGLAWSEEETGLQRWMDMNLKVRFVLFIISPCDDMNSTTFYVAF